MDTLADIAIKTMVESGYIHPNSGKWLGNIPIGFVVKIMHPAIWYLDNGVVKISFKDNSELRVVNIEGDKFIMNNEY